MEGGFYWALGVGRGCGVLIWCEEGFFAWCEWKEREGKFLDGGVLKGFVQLGGFERFKQLSVPGDMLSRVGILSFCADYN